MCLIGRVIIITNEIYRTSGFRIKIGNNKNSLKDNHDISTFYTKMVKKKIYHMDVKKE